VTRQTHRPHGSPNVEQWWRRATIYQIWPRSFADSNGDGIGDLAGIIDHLDHLVDLGVDAVWISPVYASPHDDAGYDISDYRAIDPLFGSLDEFDQLVAELHRRDLRLITDIVVNHTSDEHAWFVESRSSTTSPRRDWYWWRPPRAGMNGSEPGAEPNNWRSVFGGSAWEFDESSGEYYLHLFSRKQPDLNWEQPDVRAAVYDMMRWWVDRGVDGFRLDVINFISKNLDLPDGVVTDGSVYGDGMPHFVDGPSHPRIPPRDAQRRSTRTATSSCGSARCPASRSTRRSATPIPARGEVDMVFQFEHVGVDHGPGGRFDVRPLPLRDLKASLGRWQAGLVDTGWNSLYWCNHDQPRVVSRFGDDGEHRRRSAKMLATVLHLHRGTPFVYQGEEIGMTNFAFSDESQLRDIETLNFVATCKELGRSRAEIMEAVNAGARDHARTPMQWDDTPHAGFTTGEPWMAVHPNATSLNVAAESRRPALGVAPLPATDRAPSRAGGDRRWRLHDAARRRRTHLRLQPPPGRRRTARARQLHRRRRRVRTSRRRTVAWRRAAADQRGCGGRATRHRRRTRAVGGAGVPTFSPLTPDRTIGSHGRRVAHGRTRLRSESASQEPIRSRRITRSGSPSRRSPRSTRTETVVFLRARLCTVTAVRAPQRNSSARTASSSTSITRYSPQPISGIDLRNRIIRSNQLRSDSGSVRCASTLTCSGPYSPPGKGRHTASAGAVVNPAAGADVHCIGVRTERRPSIARFSPMPISSP
jgi:oligo-1,6-glucosidase